ncbi:MAG: type III PLP-dependent enzyme [Alphaproteobacteria bacterium]|nr:type III PLP-dependent enzyme [Alphaproteobacteria bacterium]MDP6566249.1 type III PLP-dependent enzyme [Alphaproteobacteria bacterium]MDP6814641.1 type III PLP-dependent enzyme [Alphaproteobacteria bacterium]
MTEKIDRFINQASRPTPFLVVDLDVVAERYESLRRQLPAAEVFYAVKANPAPEVISLLIELGASFDVASPAEIELTLRLGADPATLSYGNTIKKQADIAAAFQRGVELFAFDSAEELAKLARAAPGSKVFCRLLVDNQGAEWPLSRKFGCERRMARDLLLQARDLGLLPYGVAFHVGSQQMDPGQWDGAVAQAAALFRDLEGRGVELAMVNVGGGFPARYADPIAGIDTYAQGVQGAMTRHFGNRLPCTVVEPGRYIVGDAGVLQAEVVLISRKSYDDQVRWIYLDVGRFNGLAETEGEAIRYPLRTPHDGGAAGPVILAGPTCDSVDTLYENAGYRMPMALAIGDRVQILATGAYTTTYSTVGFNGFDPLPAYYI